MYFSVAMGLVSVWGSLCAEMSFTSRIISYIWLVVYPFVHGGIPRENHSCMSVCILYVKVAATSKYQVEIIFKM